MSNYSKLTSYKINTAGGPPLEHCEVKIEALPVSVNGGPPQLLGAVPTILLHKIGTDEYLITFAGNVTPAGSLLDGAYAITVRGSTENVVVLFGDFNNDGKVDDTDYATFKAAFGSHASQTGYNIAADYEGNCYVNNRDYLQFRLRYGTKIEIATGG